MFVRVIVAALLLLATSGTAWAQVGNRQIFHDVERQVLRYPHFTIFDSVQTQIEDGVVTLTGKVTMPYKRNDIERRVSGINGIREIRNRIDVLPVSQFDDDLRYTIARAIYGHSNFRQYASSINPPIHVIVEGGRVTLEGVVNSNVDRMLARSIASSFMSFEIKNDLKTEEEQQAELKKL